MGIAAARFVKPCTTALVLPTDPCIIIITNENTLTSVIISVLRSFKTYSEKKVFIWFWERF